MGKFTRLIFILSIMLIAACNRNDHADTIELPLVTNTPTRELTSEPTSELTHVVSEHIAETPSPTGEPLPTVIISPTKTTAPTSVPEQADTQVDKDKLLDSLLTINDMPTGWTGKAAEFEFRTPGGTYTFTCAELPARSIGKANVDFQMSALGPFLTETIIVYESKKDARDALADLADAASNCVEWTDEDGITYTLLPLSFPKLGDETFSIRTLGNFEADMVYIREGNVIISVLNLAFPAGIDSVLTEEIATLAIQRFEEKN